MSPAIFSPFCTPPWWRTPATRPLSCRCATAPLAPSFARCRFYAPASWLPVRPATPVGKNSNSYLQAISDYYQEQYQQACALRGDRPLPIIASGHLTTVGASKSDAVRDIYIGTLDAFPAQHFPPADYIALGHIHRAQVVGGCEHIRYSGSPLPLSFDETGKAKSVHLVSFNDGCLSAVETLEVPVTQPLAVIKGDLAAITAQLEQWRGVEQDPPVWLDIEITTEDYLHDIQRHIQALTEDLPVEVLLVRRSREQREKILLNAQRETLSELKVEEVFERRLALTEIDDDKRARLHELFTHTLHTLTAEDENA